MQLRCTYCQTMFALSHDEMLAALQHMDQHQQKYYDAHCPKCRRANRVEGKRIEILIPDWKKIIKAMEREAVKAEEKPAEPAPKPAPKTVEPAAKRPAPAREPAHKPSRTAKKK